MSTSIDKSAAKFLSVQAIVFTEIIWAVLALLFFLLFSVPNPGQARPLWYSYGTSIFELVAYLVAAILCFRNWRSPQIVSGRKVWLGIGMGMLCYFLGGVLFTFWETFLGRAAAVSPGDFFYVPAYLFLGWGMVMAFADRRLNLEIWQWGIVTGIAAISIAFATWLTIPPEKAANATLFGIEPVSAQTAPAKPVVKSAQAALKTIPASKLQTSPVPKAIVSPQLAPSVPALRKVDSAKTEAEQKTPPPAWVSVVEDTLAPLKTFLDYFYVMADVFILIVATTLLLAFWGGRFSQSWRMIAAAAFSLYIADMWFKYATARLEDYQSGGLLEIFWVFSGVLFGIGAALEYDLSRSRRPGGRRRT